MSVDATNNENGSSFSGSISPRETIFLICFTRFFLCDDRYSSFL